MSKNKALRRIAGLVCLAFFFLFSGCAGTGKKMAGEEAAKDAEKTITRIETGSDRNESWIIISGSSKLAYTAVKQAKPLSVNLYFPKTGLKGVESLKEIEDEVIASVAAREMEPLGPTSRITILLKKDAFYRVEAMADGLKVAFTRPGKKSERIKPKGVKQARTEQAETTLRNEVRSKTATVLKRVESDISEDYTEILLVADAPISDYRSFVLDNPPRIVFDLPGMKSKEKGEKSIEIGSRQVKRVRSYTHENRVRVVLDTTKENMYAYGESTCEQGLKITVGNRNKTRPLENALSSEPSGYEKEPAPARTGIITASALKMHRDPKMKSPVIRMLLRGDRVKILSDDGKWAKVSADGKTGYVRYSRRYIQEVGLPGKKALINRIDFTAEDDGRTTVIVGTTKPVEFDIKELAPRQIRLVLDKTVLPEARRRPLVTNRFPGAVDRILPGPGKKGNAFVDIQLREAVPFRVKKDANLIMVDFEPSRIPPRPFISDSQIRKPPAPKKTGLPETGRYTGEKIALDLFDTDIRNVFRILKKISGKNFAVDSDVSGKVTLSLEKPVPWDQVLDLVLKMNRLGKSEEGDIIRIAKAETLAAEEERLRTKLAAVKQAKEQEKALEPLETEYIPVSYSNAKDEILPHIEKILTSGRGSAGVDERTNMIIMTDTRAKIRQAKDIVKRLDKVTPQVIIEARIVEATTDFSRGLGVNWGAMSGYQYGLDSEVFDTANTATTPFTTVNTGGTDIGGRLAINPPAITHYGSIGFTFASLAGASLLLNAKLTAAELNNEVRIVSAPKIVTLDNKEAVIEQGREVPYNRVDESGNTTTEFIDIKLTLKVKPQVTQDNRINLTINISKRDQAGSLGNIPIISSKDAQTELLIDDGDTVVIGGILKSDTRDSSSGVPGLAKIPILGWLFKTNTVSKNKEELLIFITPRIVRLKQKSYGDIP